jgi:outer membrane lipoprotein-sorting protein
MTVEHPKDSTADILAALVVDSEADTAESDVVISKSMDEQLARRYADLLLLDSLMLQISSHDQTTTERRIERVLQGIKDEVEIREEQPRSTHRTSQSMLSILVRYGIAAVVIISVALLLMQMPSCEAMAAMDKIITAIDQAGDRTYHIIVKDSKNDRVVPRNRPSDIQGPPRNRAMLNGAMLYLRGNDKFVLYRPTPSGETVINGSDGQTRWLIRPRKPVLISSDPQAFRIPMPEELSELLTMDFRATLVQIRDNYEIRYLDEGEVPQGEGLSWMYLSARKRNRNFKGPKNIRIWADTETGILQRIELVDIRLGGQPQLKKMIIELAENEALPEDWFTHQSHHSSDAETDYLEGTSL